MPATTLDPRSALVVVDLQRGTLAAPLEPHAAADVVERNVRLADAFRARDLPVVRVRMTQSDRSAVEHEHAVTRTFPKLAETGTTEEVLTLLE